MSDDLISRRALYEKATTLEAQALDYVGKLIERDGEETSVEWKIWSAILTERTAFKHDVYDAPSTQPEIVRCKDCKWWMQQTNYENVPLSFGFCQSDDMWWSLYGETCEVAHIDTDADFYCGHAERRTDG